MRAATSLVRTGESRVPSVFVSVRVNRGRPTQAYRARLSDPQAVEIARRAGLPVYLLEARTVTALGYPIDFPPVLLVARPFDSVIETLYRIVRFVSERAVASPRFEDIALALLSINRLAARAILERNRIRVDERYLLKRVIQEELEERATSVRLFDFVPSLPRVGRALSSTSIDAQMRKNWSTGRLP
jgi:hypothetical protein